jgi:hypothetical protein
MLIPFGILSASAVGSDYELIETQILGSAVASVIFPNLDTYASIYEHLQLRTAVRSNRTTFQNTYYQLRINGDSTSSYSNHLLTGTSSAVSSIGAASETYANIVWSASQNAPANIFGAATTDIVDAYSTTKNKTIRSFGGVSGGTDPRVMLTSSAFQKTNALTSITVFSVDGNLLTGSRFSLYGIK